MAESIYVRGEGGSIILMDLPLPESIQQRFDAGLIVRVAEDGSAYSGEKPVDEVDAEVAGPVKPSRVDPKADWLTYTVAVSDLSADELEGMTKAELVKRFG